MLRVELRSVESRDASEELAARIAESVRRESVLASALLESGLTAQAMLELAAARAERDIYTRLLFVAW